MKHKKNKLRLNEIQGFYFLFKFGLVLTYILKVYCKKSSSIFLKKDMFNSLHFSFEKQKPSQVLKDFSVENLETTPSTFFSKFSSDIYLELLIIGGSIFALYLTSGAFFFFFYQYFPWQTLRIQRIAGNWEEIIIFLSYFHLLTNINLLHEDFHHFVLTGLFVIARLIADEICPP